MNEIESNKNSIRESGRVAQLDEHKPSKFADAGANPVTVTHKQRLVETITAR